MLEPLLADIDRASAALLAQTGKVGAHLRDNEWLMTIKQRTAIPGGVCEFDLPGYHYWLHGDPAARQNDLNGWIEPFLPIYDGLAIILRLLRDNGRASRQTAYRGVFQLMLTTSKVAQLLRLTVAARPALRAGDQRQQVRAQHPLHRRHRHGPRRRLRPRRRVRAGVLQSLSHVEAADDRLSPMRRSRGVEPGLALAAVLLRALQADRPRRVGERGLSRPDRRGAGPDELARRAATTAPSARRLTAVSGPRRAAQRDAVRAVRDRDGADRPARVRPAR